MFWKPIDLVALAAAHLRVARRGVDDLARVERERLADHAAPAEVVAARDDLAVRSRRARAEHERVLELHAIDGDRQVSVTSPPRVELRERGSDITGCELRSTDKFRHRALRSGFTAAGRRGTSTSWQTITHWIDGKLVRDGGGAARRRVQPRDRRGAGEGRVRDARGRRRGGRVGVRRPSQTWRSVSIAQAHARSCSRSASWSTSTSTRSRSCSRSSTARSPATRSAKSTAASR